MAPRSLTYTNFGVRTLGISILTNCNKNLTLSHSPLVSVLNLGFQRLPFQGVALCSYSLGLINQVNLGRD